MANRTIRDENRCIDVIDATSFQDLRAVDLEGGSMAPTGRKAVEARCERPNAAARCGPAQFREREIRAGIFGGRVRAIYRDMRDPQVVVPRRIAGIGSGRARRW
jgi:hypothetical protein